MALQLRGGHTSSLGKTIATSFAVLALVVQPLVSGNLPAAFAAGAVAQVYNEAELLAATSDTSVTTIGIKASFAIHQKVNLSGRNVTIDGNGNKLTFAGNAAGWQGNYLLQAYKNTIEVKNLTLTGGDAALIANGATINLKNTVDVSGNEFGGIEVSQGGGVATPAILNATNATLTNTTEANGAPTVWIDQAGTPNATVNGSFTVATHIKPNQKQYYLVAANSGVVATNVSTAATYADVQAAIDAATAGDTIRLEKDITLPVLSIRVTKAVTIDGNGKTVTTAFNRGQGGVSNAAFVVTVSNATIKNVTTKGNASGTTAAHGVVTDAGLEGVLLQNITTRDGAAGVVINGSKVTIDTIHTRGNNWYGINVDRTNAVLTIKGVTTHTEAIAIRSGDTAGSNATVVDVDKRYTKESAAPANGNIYVLDTIAPTKPTITAPGARTWHKTAPITNSWTASTDANGVAKYQVEYIYDDDHTFVGGPYREVPGTQTSRTHAPATSEQGGVTIRVRAIDFAGNASAWSSPVHYYYDAANPATDIAVSAVVDGEFTVSGTATDKLALNRVYVQLVSRVSGQRCGGTTISLIGQGAMVNWSQQYDIATLGCPEGNYAAHVSVVDMAGNTSSAGWTDDFLAEAAKGIDPAEPTDPTDPGEETPGSDDKTGTGSDTTTGGNNQNQGGSTSTDNGEVPATEEDDDADADGSANNQVFTAPIVALGDRAVLGDQDTTQNQPQASVVSDTTDTEVKGAADEKNSATFSPLGFAWYWWLLVLAAIAGLWWLLAALRRRKEEE